MSYKACRRVNHLNDDPIIFKTELEDKDVYVRTEKAARRLGSSRLLCRLRSQTSRSGVDIRKNALASFRHLKESLKKIKSHMNILGCSGCTHLIGHTFIGHKHLNDGCNLERESITSYNLKNPNL